MTVAARIANGQVAQMPYHLNRAIDNGLTQAQAAEVLPFYWVGLTSSRHCLGPLASCARRNRALKFRTTLSAPISARAPGHAAPFALGPRAPHQPAYLGDGSDLSGLVGVLGFEGSGPLLSEAFGPPGVVAGTFPCVRGRSEGAAVPGAVPVPALSGAVDVPGLVV